MISLQILDDFNISIETHICSANMFTCYFVCRKVTIEHRLIGHPVLQENEINPMKILASTLNIHPTPIFSPRKIIKQGRRGQIRVPKATHWRKFSFKRARKFFTRKKINSFSNFWFYFMRSPLYNNVEYNVGFLNDRYAKIWPSLQTYCTACEKVRQNCHFDKLFNQYLMFLLNPFLWQKFGSSSNFFSF